MSVASILDPATGVILSEYLPASHASVQSLTAGNGIAITGTSINPVVSTALAGGSGITISGTTTRTISNNGVLSLGVGAGITNSGTATAPVLTNTGLLTNSFSTQTAVYGDATNPSPAVNTQYALNANLGMPCGASYNLPATTTTIPGIPLSSLPTKFFVGLQLNPYFATATSNSILFTGAPISDRIGYRVNMTVLMTGTITDRFGVSIALKNSTTGVLNTSNYYSIGQVGILSSPKYFEPIPYIFNSVAYTLYQVCIEDMFNVGTASWITSGQSVNSEFYGEWLNRTGGSGTIAFDPTISEGLEKAFSPL
jgi:hypothetical protein